jgi:pimeloyl-ACP methyl ester carboxylesterase
MAAFAKDYDVVAIDMRGYNTSDKPQVCVADEAGNQLRNRLLAFGPCCLRPAALICCTSPTHGAH